jgi:hypothetical protein
MFSLTFTSDGVSLLECCGERVAIDDMLLLFDEFD